MKKRTRIVQFFKSLKFHLILLVLILVVVPGFIVSSVLLNNYEDQAVAIREREVSGKAILVANQIGSSSEFDNGKIESEVAAQLNLLSTTYDGRVMVINGDMRVIFDTYNTARSKFILSKEVVQCFSGESVINYDKKNHFIELVIPITPSSSSNEVVGAMVISVSTDMVAQINGFLSKVAWITVAIVVFVFVFGGILYVNILMRPLKKVSVGIEHVQNGYQGERLEVNEFTETSDICVNFNEMLARMKVLDDSREEFVSNVSHELKTPLTSIKVLADSINSMPEAPLEMYQEFMADITNEIDRETKIINDLLSLVKMDKSASDLNIVNMNMNELVEQIIKRLQPIADKQKVALVLESFRPIMADVDEVKITLAIANLIENAIKYNKIDGDGWVHITLNADHQYFYLKVEDSGMGMPEEALDHIWERFYRVDKSHSREIGGTGLGLAITRNAILMHRGAVKVYSVLGEGTTFDVRIPLNYMV